MKVLKCPCCGAHLKESDTKCEYCGSYLETKQETLIADEITPADNKTTKDVAEDNSMEQLKKYLIFPHNKFVNFLIFLFLFCVMPPLGIVYIVLLNMDKKEN